MSQHNQMNAAAAAFKPTPTSPRLNYAAADFQPITASAKKNLQLSDENTQPRSLVNEIAENNNAQTLQNVQTSQSTQNTPQINPQETVYQPQVLTETYSETVFRDPNYQDSNYQDPTYQHSAGYQETGYQETTYQEPQEIPTAEIKNDSMAPVTSFCTNSDTVVHFDKQQELIWLASSQGQITSMYPVQNGFFEDEQTGQKIPNLYFERYTAVNLANTQAGYYSKYIHSLQSIQNGIIFSTTKAVSCRTKTGLHKWTFSDPKLTANLSTLCVSNINSDTDSVRAESMRYNPYSRNSQPSAFFTGQQHDLVQLDIETGKVANTRKVTNDPESEFIHLLKMNSDGNLFAADTQGNISLYDTRTMNTTQTFNAHAGGILDFTFADSHRLISTGLSLNSMGGGYPRFIQIYDLRYRGTGYQANSPMQIPFQSQFIRYLPNQDSQSGALGSGDAEENSRYLFVAQDGFSWVCPKLTPGGRPRVNEVSQFHLGSGDGLDAVSSVDTSENGKYAAVLMKSGVCHYIANSSKPTYYEQFNHTLKELELPKPLPNQPFRTINNANFFEPLSHEPNKLELSNLNQKLHYDFPEAPLPKKKDLTAILKNLQKTKIGDLDIHFGRIPRNMHPNQAPYEFRTKKNNKNLGYSKQGVRRQTLIPDKYNVKKILARDLSRKIRPLKTNKFYHAIVHCLYHVDDKIRESLTSFSNFDQESSLATELGQLFHKMSVNTPVGNKPVCSEQFDCLFHLQRSATALHLTDTDDASLIQANSSTPSNTDS